ncbi:hypothetical protein [Campylobacter sp. RM16192]|uniref:hypothetical protein n=1 Tax=Campylobacter sp. RM16192 TaxID=1660080 RepID=UPI0014523C0A|nr:hypothetical protein [Campylobacter sp. RM16192]QCD52790.1 hypothetical protein CDOMC_1183 [Campylobacter sp. RM16192]
MTLDEAKQKIEALENKTSILNSEIETLKSLINSLTGRVVTIETNGLGMQVRGIEENLTLQKIKVARLERNKRDGRF